jgi:hypothetical protein
MSGVRQTVVKVRSLDHILNLQNCCAYPTTRVAPEAGRETNNVGLI